MKLPIKKYTLFRMINSKMQLNMTRMFSWGRRGGGGYGQWDSVKLFKKEAQDWGTLQSNKRVNADPLFAKNYT